MFIVFIFLCKNVIGSNNLTLFNMPLTFESDEIWHYALKVRLNRRSLNKKHATWLKYSFDSSLSNIWNEFGHRHVSWVRQTWLLKGNKELEVYGIECSLKNEPCAILLEKIDLFFCKRTSLKQSIEWKRKNKI